MAAQHRFDSIDYSSVSYLAQLRNKLFLTASVLALLLTPACSSKPLVDKGTETSATVATFRWITSKYKLLEDPETTQLLERVTSRLHSASQLPSSRLALKNLSNSDSKFTPPEHWQLFVIDDSQANAFSAGSGIVLITRAMIVATSSEAELAAVISHEISHQLLGHTREALAEAQAREISTSEQPASSPNHSNKQPPGYSLSQELDADTMSLSLLYSAGYNLQHSISSLALGFRQNAMDTDFGYSRMNPTLESQKLDSKLPPAWLSQRVSNLQQKIVTYGNISQATENSREFNRVRRILMAIS